MSYHSVVMKHSQDEICLAMGMLMGHDPVVTVSIQLHKGTLHKVW